MDHPVNGGSRLQRIMMRYPRVLTTFFRVPLVVFENACFCYNGSNNLSLKVALWLEF